jgi:transcriptional regulator of acetoin/glycerol metabolism
MSYFETMPYTTPPSLSPSHAVARSWQRSLAAGLQPEGHSQGNLHCTDAELRQNLERNHRLLSHSIPVMQYLFEQVRCNQNIVILADQNGTLMHTLGDALFLDKAQRVALSRGASWQEEYRGTNAIGTALIEGTGVEIHGNEHFLTRHHFLTCTAAPIRSCDGRLLGVLDISGEEHHGHPHSLGLVTTAAHMIENRLLLEQHSQNICLHFHTLREGIGTVAEGIVALSEDGIILGANRAAAAWLQGLACTLGLTNIEQLVDIRMRALLDHAQRQPQTPLRLHWLHRNSISSVFARVDVPTQSPARLQPTPIRLDALSALDTGDAQWRSAADKVRRVMDKPIPILIQGESGAGKEFLARAIHDSSHRRDKPFVAINCAAIPDNLIEAELFGYTSGAFTGARKEGSIGRLREAHGGTLFLDEIGDMPLAMQTRLLRVLQERSVTPLGGGKTVAVDFSLICATHCHLREQAQDGRFRSDLYYRINGLTVFLPPLRERSDFEAIVKNMLKNPANRLWVEQSLLSKMKQYHWPGNLRQLASVLRTASAMLDPHENEIDWNHLPDDIVQELTESQPNTQAPSTPPATTQNLQTLEKIAIEQALQASQGNISQAARTLGISRQTLYRKILPQSPR